MATVVRVRFWQRTHRYVQTLLQSSWRETKHPSCMHTTSFLFVVGQEIRMPSLSPTMSEGTIVKWLKQEGDRIVPGDVLCDIQTDKAVVSFETEEEGVLAKILISENSKDIKVGTLIGLMVGEGEDWKSVEVSPYDTRIKVDSAHVDTPGGHQPPAGGGRPLSSSSSSSSGGEPPTCAGHSAPKPSFRTTVLTSYGPAVRQLLLKYDLKSNQISPTGHRSKILREDVLNYITANKLTEKPPKSVPLPSKAGAKAHSSQPTSAAKVQVKRTPGAGFEDIEVSGMRRTIAKRLTESKRDIPHSFSSVQCSIEKVLEMRRDMKRDGISVSINDFVIKAAAHALQQCPEVNAHYINGQVILLPQIDISVAVATAVGLITPIVRDAAGKGLAEISSIVKELSIKAREGKLQLHEFQGGSFTVSNLGMFGIKEFSAIINLPQCAILSVGGGQVALGEDKITQSSMNMTLSYDRRAVEDSLAAEFLEVVRDMLENPVIMLLGGHQHLRAKLGL